ncbi:MAG: peptidylprolyl isomerase [Bacteroidia bacterium]
MIIGLNKVVSVSYELTVNEDGTETLVEKTEENRPFVFLFGGGGLLEAFENNLEGLKVGDTFDFNIPAHQAYGESQQEYIVRIPIESFLDEEGNLDTEMVKVGNMLPMVDQDGNRLQGLVVDVNDQFVIMDFNHPLADKDLRFVGTVLKIREATPDEIAHGHVHGDGGIHH